MKLIGVSLALVGLWIAGVLIFHLSVGLMMLAVGLAFIGFVVWDHFADKESTKEEQ